MHHVDSLTAHEQRQISVAAGVDPRTLRSYLRGKARSTTAARIEAALLEYGRDDLVVVRGAQATDGRDAA